MSDGVQHNSSHASIIESQLHSHRITVRDYVAMGTQFSITAVECPEEVISDLVQYTNQLELLWTRFSQDSELMKLNNSNAEAMKVSAETIRLVQEMQYGFELTQGLFDPNVLSNMVTFGFATSTIDQKRKTRFEQVQTNASTILDVEINITDSTIKMPRGIGLDAGGIGKGLAADLLAERAIAQGALGIAVFAGGEVRVAGTSPMEAGWTISVQHPNDETGSLCVLDLVDGGVATSSISGRTSPHGGHIIDPRHHKPALEAQLQATVVAGDAVDAEVLAKLCLLLPAYEAIERIESIGVDALIYTSTGDQVVSAGWEDMCR